jgi:ABC-type transport system involved in multi-copper enzyme maturation permease subunit
MNKILAMAVVVAKELIRRKDFYVLFILTALITLLLGGVNIFNEEKVVRGLKEVCLLLIWISMLAMAVVTAARQIPSEIESRTVFPLLAKPVSRAQVLLGKFTGCWLVCGLALLVFYVFFGAMSASREQVLPVASYLQALWMHWVFLAMVIGMTLAGSLLFAAPSSNATIVLIVTVGILLVGEHLNKVAVEMSGLSGGVVAFIYYAMPHLEFYDLRLVITHNWPANPWGMILLASVYGACYTGIFLVIGWWLFRRKVLTQ